MLVYLKHHQIDKKKWDSCIFYAKEGILYAYSWYLDIVAPNWDAIILLNKDSYISVMPLPVKTKYTIS